MLRSDSSQAPVAVDGIVNRRRAHELRVVDLIRETRDACSVVLAVPDHLRELFRYEAGQFLTFELPYQGSVLRRCYSLASSPASDEGHKVTIKRVESGRASNWFNDQLKVGDTVRVWPPEGRFVIARSAGPLVLFAGGSGITPIISIIKTALAHGARPITLVYANRDPQSVIFRAELERLGAEHSARLAVIHRYDGEHGYLRSEHVPSLVSLAHDGEYFLCGPAAFMDAVERGLLAAGVPSECIHLERFLSPADPKPNEQPDGACEGPQTVEVELQGRRYSVRYGGKTLLQTALDAGLDAPYSCEAGICGCCVARLAEGQVESGDDQALTAEEKKRGLILCCQARPVSATCRIEFVDP